MTNHFQAVATQIRGPLTPILTAFAEDGRMDIEATCRWVDRLIAQGIKLFWTTQGTSHYMTLSDQEVMDLNRELSAVIRGRGIFIASTPWHWSTRQCQAFVETAAHFGADVVKLQFVYDWQPTDDQVINHYQSVANVSPLPLFAYTRGKPGVSTDLLRRIVEIPQFIGMKNDTDDYYGQERYLRLVNRHRGLDHFLVVTGGGLSSVLSGYDYGIRAYGDMTIWYDPELSLTLYNALQEGKRQELLAHIQTVEGPLRGYWATLAPGMHWSWGHVALRLLGYFRSSHMRFPLHIMDGNQTAAVRAFLEGQGLLPSDAT